MLLIFISLLALVYSQNYAITLAYAADDTNCNGALDGFSALNNPTACTPTSCVCTASACSRVLCNQTELPTVSGTPIETKFFNTANCEGDPNQVAAASSGRCTNTSIGASKASQRFTCGGGGVRTEYWNSDDSCSGDPNTNVFVPFSGSYCQATGTQSSLEFTCNSVCFHEASTITYEGKQMNLNALSSHEDCAIPHKVNSDGVKITTTCPGLLRLTHRHLVMTPEGWVEAGNLVKGSKLYSKINGETADCEIISIETERNQEYFGLNCYESNVLADGYWVSTFGNQHTVPAAWMKYGGAVLGIQRASAWGDSIVKTLERWRWL